jgi:hypothetical protein
VTSRLLMLVATALAAVASLSLGGSPQAPILRATAGGALELESTRDGQAVLVATGLAPGDSAEGTLSLTNRAPGPQRLTLSMSGLQDTPGPGGGALSGWLDLRVERAGDVVYAGKLADLPALDLGSLDPAASAPFRLVVTLPEQGPAVDDAYAGASVEVGWTWKGDADVSGGGPDDDDSTPVDPVQPPRGDDDDDRPVAEPPVDVAPSGRPAPPDIDSVEGPPGGGGARVPAVRLWLGGRASQRLGRSLALSAVCRPGCTLRAAARVLVGRRWRALGRRSLGSLAATSAPGTLRFSLSALQQRSLRATLRRHGALKVRITVTAVAPGHRTATKVRTLRLHP